MYTPSRAFPTSLRMHVFFLFRFRFKERQTEKKIEENLTELFKK